VNGEAAVPRIGRELRELRMTHADQCRVIAALQVDLGLLLDAIVASLLRT
jgi:hypothetical protein